MFTFFEELSWVWGSVIIVALFVLFTVCGILLVRRTINIKTLKSHHDVAGVVYANLGVLYSVLLGFTAVNVQQRFDKVKETSRIEASYLAELFRDSQVFPEAEGARIRQALRNYGESVVNDEWAKMSNRFSNPNTVAAMQEVWEAYYAITPKDKREEAWYSESIGKLNLLIGARLARLMGGEESLGPEMWTLLILGSIIIVAFSWFFGLESLTSHLFMASALAASTAFLLFLIYSLDTAFTGDVSVPPEAMERVLKHFIN